MRFKFSIGAPVILTLHTDKATNVEPARSVWMGRVSVVLKVETNVLKVETNVLCLCSSNNFHKNMKTIMSPQVNRPSNYVVWGVRQRRLRGSVGNVPYHRLHDMSSFECIG